MKFRPVLSATALGLLLVAAACIQNVADLPARDHSKDGSVTPVTLPTSTDVAKSDPRDQPIPRVSGKPMWAANRTHTAEENAQYQFEKHGSELGTATLTAFVAKAHDFTGHPPSGAEHITRANGDTLMYDAKSNIFAVVTKDGAPRTILKPSDGASYWAQQKEEVASGGDSRSGGRSGSKSSARKQASQG